MCNEMSSYITFAVWHSGLCMNALALACYVWCTNLTCLHCMQNSHMRCLMSSRIHRHACSIQVGECMIWSYAESFLSFAHIEVYIATDRSKMCQCLEILCDCMNYINTKLQALNPGNDNTSSQEQKKKPRWLPHRLSLSLSSCLPSRLMVPLFRAFGGCCVCCCFPATMCFRPYICLF